MCVFFVVVVFFWGGGCCPSLPHRTLKTKNEKMLGKTKGKFEVHYIAFALYFPILSQNRQLF